MLECQLEDRVDPLMTVNEHAGGRGLVVYPGALGDFLCFLPTLKVISQLQAGSHIEMVMRSDFSDLLGNRYPNFSVHSLDNHEIGRLFVDSDAEGSNLKNNLTPYDFIYSWFGARDSNFVRNLKLLCDDDCKIYPFRPSETRTHLMDYYGSCLNVSYAAQHYPEIPFTSSALTWSERYWSEHELHGERVLAIAPGSGAKEKNWALSYYLDVIRWWRDQKRGKVLVFLGPAEEESAARAVLGDHAMLVRQLALGQVAALLGRCKIYLGNDSGITHLAAAVGVSTVALFGPTDSVQWRPRGKRVTVISQDVECSPCNPSAMRSCDHRKCLSRLVPDTVTSIIDRMLAQGCLDKDRIEF